MRNLTIAFLFVGPVGCTALSDFDGLSGPAVDGSADAQDECRQVEDCTNGVDDDCNGLVDCSDPNCDGYSCTEPVPDGWVGYAAYFEGVPEDVPACPSVYPKTDLEVGRDPFPETTICSPCICAPPTDVKCGNPPIDIFQDEACSSMKSWEVSLVSLGECQKFPLTGAGTTQGQPESMSLGAPAATGTCVPSGGVALTSWTTAGLACLPLKEGGGCSENRACIPKPPSGFKPGACIYRAGDRECPSPYGDRSKMYKRFDASQACTDCTCGPVTGASCSGTLTVSQSSVSLLECSRAEPDVEIIADAPGCYQGMEPGEQHYFDYDPNPPKGGSCEPRGGLPAGAVTNDNTSVFTICCRPL